MAVLLRPWQRLARMPRGASTSRGSRLHLAAVSAALWGLAFAGDASAAADPLGLSPEHEAKRLRAKVWRLEQGLPQNTVTSIVQDEQGYLWLGTFGGVARFDGMGFEVWDPTSGLLHPRVLALALGPDGSLWIGHERRGLTRLDPITRAVRPVPLPSPLSSSTVHGLAFDRGRLWVATPGAAIQLDPGEALARTVVDPRIRQLAVGLDHIYVGGPGLLGATNTSSPSSDLETLAKGRRIHRLGEDPDGRLWVLHDRGIDRWDGTELSPRIPSSEESWHLAGPLFGYDGSLWFGFGSRIYRHPSYRDLADRSDTRDILSSLEYFPVSSPVRSLYEDHERNVWVGTEGGGLWRLTVEPFSRLGRGEGLRASAVGPIVPDGAGGLWVGNGCEGAAHIVGDQVTEYDFEQVCLHALVRDPDGTMWGGSDAVLQRAPDGRITTHPVPVGCGEVSALRRSRRGDLWAGTTGGCVLRFGPSRFEPVPTPLTDRIHLIQEAPDGTLWFGERSRILLLNGATTKMLGPEHGVPIGSIRALHLAGDDTWVGSYGGGLALLRGERAYAFSRRDGLPDNFLSHILDDGRGYLWFNSNRGAFRVPRFDFEEVIAGRQEKLRARPLPTGEAELGSPSAWFDGQRIHVPTIEGLVRIDLDALWPHPPPPLTLIERPRVDGHELDPGTQTAVPPGARRFDADISAPLLRWPELASFEYQLLGFDPAWRRTTHRAIHYERLPAGSYLFRVRAVNEEERHGPVSEIRFRIRPYLVETTLFQGGSAAAFLGLLLLGHRWRTRKISAHNRNLERQVRQREQAERALEDREARYRRVFASSVNAFVVEDAEGRVADLNPAAEQMFGGRRDGLIGRRTRDLFDPEAPVTEPGNIVCLRTDGRRFEGRVTRRSMGHSNHNQTLLTVADLSPLLDAKAQEQRLQAQLAHSQRVEAIGRLAGGVAHDVNNMLTVVKGQARLAQEALAEGDVAGVQESLRDILESSERTGNITRQLLALGRRRQVQPVELDTKEHLCGLRRMLERLTPDQVVVRWSFGHDPCVARLDPTQFQQVVVNLVMNATQALPRGGTVEVSLHRVEGEPEHLPPGALDGKAWVNLSVEDDGIGMSEEVRSRIFEPFFSTKPQGENTGLGLSVVHAIVHDAGGRYFVDSKEGRGSRFDILFPAVGGAPPAPAVETKDLPSRGGHERVLFCEDEAPVRRTTSRILERAGYQVVTAAHPFEALERLRSGTYDLLVTDIMMPDMNGRALADAARQIAPDLPVLYVSGYTSDIVRDMGENEEFIEKPFTARDLLSVLRRMLER